MASAVSRGLRQIPTWTGISGLNVWLRPVWQMQMNVTWAHNSSCDACNGGSSAAHASCTWYRASQVTCGRRVERKENMVIYARRATRDAHVNACEQGEDPSIGQEVSVP